MTPKEKAIELIAKIEIELVDIRVYRGTIKKLALIAVDEILKSNPCSEGSDRGGNFMWVDDTYYWEQVKYEINNL